MSAQKPVASPSPARTLRDSVQGNFAALRRVFPTREQRRAWPLEADCFYQSVIGHMANIEHVLAAVPDPSTPAEQWEAVDKMLASQGDDPFAVALSAAVDRARQGVALHHAQEIERLTMERDVAFASRDAAWGDCHICHHEPDQAPACSMCHHSCRGCALKRAEADLARLRQDRDALQTEVQFQDRRVDRSEARVHALEGVLGDLVDRISNGHPQSIGSIDNVRMVQFDVEEIARYRAALAPTKEPT